MIRRSTWIAIIVFALLLGLVWILQNRQSDSATAAETPEAVPLLNIATDDVASLRINSSEGSIFFANRDEAGTWTLVQPSLKGELNSSIIDSNVSQLANLRSLTSVDAATGLEALGLVSPRYIITLSLKDGREVLLEVGDETLTGSGYYVQVDNSEVLVAQKFTIQTLVDMVDSIPFQPTATPELTETPASSGSPGEVEGTLTPTP